MLIPALISIVIK